MATTKVTSTNNSTTDPANIQAALDAFSGNGNILQLEQADADTPFDLGTTMIEITDKGVTVVGLPAATPSGRPELLNGGNGTDKNTWLVDAAGYDVFFEELVMKNYTGRGIYYYKVKDHGIDHVDFLLDTGDGHTFVGPFGPQVSAIVYSSIIDAGAFKGPTGQGSVENCLIDMELTADPADPYAGDRSVLNPATIANGGAWPGPGNQNPGGWITNGIVVAAIDTTAVVTVKNNVIKNVSARGLFGADQFGLSDFNNNVVITPYGIHQGGSGIGCMGALLFSGFFVSQPDVRTIHGDVRCTKNQIVMQGQTCGGIICGAQSPFKLNSISVAQNNISLTDNGFAGLFVLPNNLGYFGQNRIQGSGNWAAIVGLTAPVRVFGTDKNAFVGNNVKGFTPAVATAYFTPDSRQNSWAGGGLAVETVTNAGDENKITGVTSVAGGIGQDLQDVLDHLRTIPMP